MNYADYNTIITVRGKDGKLYDVAVCRGDTAAVIGANVIAVLEMAHVFQRTTLRRDKCGDYAERIVRT